MLDTLICANEVNLRLPIIEVVRPGSKSNLGLFMYNW
jgi:hypothetical protein